MRHLPPIHAVVGYTLGLIWGKNTPEQFLEWTDQEFLQGIPDACEDLGIPLSSVDLDLAQAEFDIQGKFFRDRARLEIAEAERRAIEQLEDRLDYEHFVRTHWYP